ncbi:MAG: sulfate transporter CysZ [Gammaproteobacteria bacterium]
MNADLVKGAGYLLTGARLLRASGMKRFVLIPLLISAVVFTGGFWLTGHWLAHVIDTLNGLLPHWLAWLSFLLWPVFVIVALTIGYFGFILLANLVAAPFNGWLAEAVEHHLTGQQPPARNAARSLPHEALTAIRNEINKTVYFLLWGIPCLLALLIPVIGAVIWFLYGAWALVCNYADFSMSNDGLKFADQRKLLLTRKSLSFGFGIAALALTLVPIVNFIAMPAAVAGATAMYVQELRSRNQAEQRPSA